MPKTIYKGEIINEWVDYNGHMNDAEYARVFSLAGEELMIEIGMDEEFFKKETHTIFTLENHICYLAEAFEGEAFHVTAQILDYDEKLLHPFFIMKNERGEQLATSEQMFIGIDQETRRSANFPDEIYQSIQALAEEHRALPKPKQAGRKISINKQ